MIDYEILANSIKHYKKRGFERIEAPWWVSQEIMDITRPPGAEDYFIPKNKKCLVASGEQSFLYMANKGRLPKGKYQTITPCFRDESIGILHKKGFMKNELIIADSQKKQDLDDIIMSAREFFEQYIDKKKLVIKKEPAFKASLNYDIVLKAKDQEIELGSYGIRKAPFFSWIYGTGVAEPRLSRALMNL